MPTKVQIMHKGARERGALRRYEALELRLGGASFRQIASAMHVTVSHAHKMIQTELERLAESHADDVEQLRLQESERLDRLMVRLWPKAIAGSLPHVDRVLKLSERRSKLLGLDAPQRSEIASVGLGAFTLDLGSPMAMNADDVTE